MKTTIRIPTVQFGYIEAEVECASFEEAVEAHNQALEAYHAGLDIAPGSGMDRDSFNKKLDQYILQGALLGSDYELMNLEQQQIIQCIKRHKNRQK